MRILGLETEFALASSWLRPVANDTPPPLTPAECITEMFVGHPRAHTTRSAYLANGGRMYVDLGKHPEYATAECTTVPQVIAQDLAGEQIWGALVHRANARLADQQIRIHLIKNNRDSHGTSYGCHENYLISRQFSQTQEVVGLVTYLVARTLLTGAGDLNVAGNFELSGRASAIACVVSKDPTKSRPIITAREEAHADESKFARLQVVHGDSHLSGLAGALTMGLTSQVLDALEGGLSLQDLQLRDPIATLHAISAQGTQARCWLNRCITIGAVELLAEIVDRVAAVKSAAADWTGLAREALTALSAGQSHPAVEWTTVRSLLNHYADKPIGQQRRVLLALKDVSGDLVSRLRQREDAYPTFVPSAAIKEALTTPPTTTRAAVRGSFVAAAESANAGTSVNWTHVRLDTPPGPQIDLMDPWQTEHHEVAALVASLQQRPR